MVGVVRHRAAIGQNEFATAGLRQGVFCLGYDLLLRALGKGAKLVPATHQAFARLDASFTQARSGDAIGPAEHLHRVVQ